ncbi:hypothetical protein, partial [Rhodoferax sp.]|uniref:calcium-binding protein n=1 Tax=Rhodoferax sp. TaxID=50421 RepID=UPI0025D5E1D9
DELDALSTTNKVIQTGEGTLTLTNYNSGTGVVSYTYTLNATIDNDSKVPATGDAVSLTDFTDNVSLVVNGLGGTTASDTLSIRVVDDTPVAVNEPTVTLTESHIGDTDWLASSVHLVSGSDGSGSLAYTPITTINGLSVGDTLKINWSGDSGTINWKLVDLSNPSNVLMGSSTDKTMDVVLSSLPANGNYALYVDYDGANATKSIDVEDVHVLHTVTTADSGNVIVDDPGADTVGADGAAVYSITYVNTSGATVTEALGGDGVADVVTKYGTLHIEADGDYTYTVKQDAVPLSDADGQVEDNLSYTLMDGDGDTASANMNYVINDIKAPSVLDVTMITNTNNQIQPVILTFVDQANPEFAYARLFALGAQGQQGTFTPDTGFNIGNTHSYVVGLEAASTTTKVNLTDFTIEGVPIFGQATGGGGGVTSLILDDDSSISSDQTALVAVVTPNDPPATQALTDSMDGDGTGTAMTDTTPTVVNYLYGAGGDDVLNGNSGTDILNGGTGIDSVDGAGGNDMLVYDLADFKLDGGTGDDVLRIDDGALALFNTVGLNQATVDLTGNTAIKNVEVLLLTDDAQGAADKGTTLVLRAEDVLHFTDSDHVLTIVGNNSDKLDLSDDTTATWAQTGTSGDGNFAIWTATFADTSTVTLKVETEVSVLLNNP